MSDPAAFPEQMGLTLVEEGEAVGFDRCTYWLMRK